MIWRLLDLFSGIGGFSLAAKWVWGDDLEIVAFCEINKFCQKVLKKHWPHVPIVEDVRDVTPKVIANQQSNRLEEWGLSQQKQTGQLDRNSQISIDLLTGGFPCQPFSVAGKRKGKEDNRFLWPEMLRIIKEFRPRWIVAENVAGIVRMVLDDCLSDLEGEGYATGTQIIPACAVNAPHGRDRVWIVAHAERGQDNGRERGYMADSEGCQESSNPAVKSGCQDVAESSTPRFQNGDARKNRFGAHREFTRESCRYNPETWSTEPDVGRVAHGIPNRVDRLKSLGNAIVPQVAERIFRAIKAVEQHRED